MTSLELFAGQNESSMYQLSAIWTFLYLCLLNWDFYHLTWHNMYNIDPLSIFGRPTFGYKSLGICLYLFCTSGFWFIYLFIFVHFWQICSSSSQIGWIPLVNRNFQILLQILNWIEVWTMITTFRFLALNNLNFWTTVWDADGYILRTLSQTYFDSWLVFMILLA